MTTVILSINVSQAPDKDDIRAMEYIVSKENIRRKESNKPMLPESTKRELKESYEICLAGIMTDAHLSYIQQAFDVVQSEDGFKGLRKFWADSTPEQRSQAISALGG